MTAGCATLLWFKPPLSSDNGEDDRRIELSANARGNPHAKDIAAAFQHWQDELGPQRARLGITSLVSDFTLDHGSLRIYLTPLDPQGRTLAKLREEIISLLTPQLAVTLDDHLSRARGEAVEAVETDPKQSADDRKKAEEKRADGKRKRDAAKKNAAGPQGGGGFGGGWAAANQVTLRMLAPDEATIDEAWNRLRGLLLTTPGVQWPGSPLAEPPHDLELALTPVAEERGWRADQLATQVTRYAGTRQVLSLPDGRVLRVGPLEDQPRTLARLLGVEVMKDAGPELLDNLVTRDETPTQVQIRRRDGLSQREFTINVEPAAKAGLIARLPELAKAADLPAGVQVQLGWRETRSQQGNDQMLLSIVLAFLVIYLIMGILYESVLAPLAVMATVLLAMVTVWALLGYVHLSLDLMVFLGLFMLVGIVVNHGVVLIDRIDAAVPMHRLAEAHLRRRAPLAVAAAARRRMAPVLLTSLTTIAGAIPMAFSNGRIDGTPISGLGLSLTIGLSAATVFTLVVMPVVYQWFALLRAGALRLLRTW
ncbi:MAG: efflux RND transporter permease subunit [Planctomycetes bacterium]|nr:efflux RND transporter permease subunit [Planctomycetota bacterium]